MIYTSSWLLKEHPFMALSWLLSPPASFFCLYSYNSVLTFHVTSWLFGGVLDSLLSVFLITMSCARQLSSELIFRRFSYTVALSPSVKIILSENSRSISLILKLTPSIRGNTDGERWRDRYGTKIFKWESVSRHDTIVPKIPTLLACKDNLIVSGARTGGTNQTMQPDT